MTNQFIPDEAVDAAVDALVASRLGDHAGINGEEFAEAARAALQAATPHMLARAWDEGFSEGWDPDGDEHANPYRQP